MAMTSFTYHQVIWHYWSGQTRKKPNTRLNLSDLSNTIDFTYITVFITGHCIVRIIIQLFGHIRSERSRKIPKRSSNTFQWLALLIIKSSEHYWSGYTRKRPNTKSNLSDLSNTIDFSLYLTPKTITHPKYPETKFHYLSMYSFVYHTVISILQIRMASY